MKRKYNFDVDIVIPWVDGSDKKWLAKKNEYLSEENKIDIDASANRYRDWDNLQYVFRGIEKFAPWVRKVFLITDNQKPQWLNLKCDKLVLVDHKDYIPQQYLPTFSSHPIELNMHRIKGLSEHFIYLNDDLFFTKPNKVSDFFTKDGLPKILAMESARAIGGDIIFYNILSNNTNAIDSRFNRQDVKKSNKKQWYSLKSPIAFVINKFYDFGVRGGWTGFYIQHLPAPFLKSSIEECWNMFSKELELTSSHKFRSRYDVNQYLFTEYMLCTKRFKTIGFSYRGKSYYLNDTKFNNVAKICDAIKKQKHKTMCLNDVGIKNFNKAKIQVNAALNSILPQKSSFEI